MKGISANPKREEVERVESPGGRRHHHERERELHQPEQHDRRRELPDLEGRREHRHQRARPDVVEEGDRHVLRAAEEEIPQDHGAQKDRDRILELRAAAGDVEREIAPDHDVDQRPLEGVDHARGVAAQEQQVAQHQRADPPRAGGACARPRERDREYGRHVARPARDPQEDLLHGGGVEVLAAEHALADLQRRALGHHAAQVQEDHPVTDLLDLGHVVRRVQDRETALAPQAQQQLARLVRDVRIQARGRLVEHQDRRVVQQRAREAGAHLLAEREIAELLARLRAQLEELDRPLHRAGPRAVETGVDAQVLAHREAPVHQRLGRGEAHQPQRRLAILEGIGAEQPHAPRGGLHQPEQHVQRGGLAGAVRTEQAEHLAPAHLEGDAREGGRVREALHELAHADGGLGGRERHGRGGTLGHFSDLAQWIYRTGHPEGRSHSQSHHYVGAPGQLDSNPVGTQKKSKSFETRP